MPDSVRIPLEVGLDDLAEQFLSVDRQRVMDFLIAVDVQMADYDFTVQLRDRLNAALAAEDDAAEKFMGNPTAEFLEFLEWLVRMDDLADDEGCKDRQVVTLTAIISRARNLLGSEA